MVLGKSSVRAMPTVGSGRYSPGPGMVKLLEREEVSYQELRPKLAKCSPISPDFFAIDSNFGAYFQRMSTGVHGRGWDLHPITTFRCLHTTTPCARRGSRTQPAQSLCLLPMAQLPVCGPPRLSETELPTSPRRHSSNISCATFARLLRFLRESAHDPDNRVPTCRPASPYSSSLTTDH